MMEEINEIIDWDERKKHNPLDLFPESSSNKRQKTNPLLKDDSDYSLN